VGSIGRTVNAQVRYINPEWRGRTEAPRIGSRESRHAHTARRDIVVHDARVAVDAGLGLETSGFTLRAHPTTSAGTDVGRRRADYHPEMLDLVGRESGALHTFMLGDLVRTEDQRNFNFAYSRFVHCDYNAASIEPMSVALLKRSGVEPDPNWTYAWYNTWQPFDRPATQNPLALLDVRSLGPGDLIDYRYTGYETGEEAEGGLVAAPVYDPAHRWYYYPGMTPEEVLLTKQNDARPGHTTQCPHTSFFDKTQPDDVAPRRSVETRILAVFER
jgi:hypothetical protein